MSVHKQPSTPTKRQSPRSSNSYNNHPQHSTCPIRPKPPRQDSPKSKTSPRSPHQPRAAQGSHRNGSRPTTRSSTGSHRQSGEGTKSDHFDPLSDQILGADPMQLDGEPRDDGDAAGEDGLRLRTDVIKEAIATLQYKRSATIAQMAALDKQIDTLTRRIENERRS